ncbi:MAG: rhomboid family intramembrane serine protease [Ignavibacteria bacterium]
MNNLRRTGFGGFSFFPPAIKTLLILNVLVYLFVNLFMSNLRLGNVNIGTTFFRWFSLQPIFSDVKSLYSAPFLPWQLFTYMFLHGDFTHIFFNMFALWMFGVELENLWGTKRFLFYYFLCGLGAAVANLFIAPLFSPVGPTIGASGAVYGILVAFGYLFPNRYIYIYFMIPLKAKYLVILYMLLELFAVTSQSSTGIAHIAHLGGAIVGFVYLISTSNRRLRIFDSSPFTRNLDNKNPTYTPHDTSVNIHDANYTEVDTYENDYDRHLNELRKRVDSILDKLGKYGYDSLTDEEKRILFEESKKLK